MDSADRDWDEFPNLSFADMAVLMVHGPCVTKAKSLDDANTIADELRDKYRVGEYGVKLRVKFDTDEDSWVVVNRKE